MARGNREEESLRAPRRTSQNRGAQGNGARRTKRPAQGSARRVPTGEQAGRVSVPEREPQMRRRAEENGHAPVYDQDDGRRRQAADAPPPQRQRKRARRLTQAEMRRRRIRRRLATAVLVLAVILAGIVLSVVLLFKVNKYEFQNMDGSMPAGTGVYTEDEIIAALGVDKGDNLFSFRSADKAAELNRAFPLLENVEVHRRIPDTIVIRIQPAVESFCIQTDSGWAVLSRLLKVIGITGEQPDLPVLTAQVSAAPQQGSILALDQENGKDTLMQLLDALDQAELADSVTAIDITSTDEISFVYQGRIRVNTGTLNNLDYKMKWTTYILLNENGDGCSETDTGVLDISSLRSDGTIRPTFAQGDPNAETAPAPEETPESPPPEEEPVPAEDAVPAEDGGDAQPAA